MTSSELEKSTRLRASGSVYARPFGDEMVLLDFARGEYFGLDEVGAEIWRSLERGETLGAIAAGIARQYDVSEEQALRDIVAIVGEMRVQSLVEPMRETKKSAPH